jgi:hypothetical protein
MKQKSVPLADQTQISKTQGNEVNFLSIRRELSRSAQLLVMIPSEKQLDKNFDLDFGTVSLFLKEVQQYR